MSTILSAAEIEGRAKQIEINSKRYLELEAPVRDLAHMAAITAVFAEALLGGDEPNMEDGEVVIRMGERQHGQLIFAINKVRDMAEEINKAF